jgi:hypothetical protein
MYVLDYADEDGRKKLNKYEQNIEDLWWILWIMGTEGEAVWAKGIENIFNKTIAENFLNLEKEMIIQVQKTFGTPGKKLLVSYYS